MPFVIETPEGNKTISADLITGELLERVKIGIGSPGASVDLQPADADSLVNSRVLPAGALVFNGTNWDRARSVGALQGGLSTAGMAGVGVMVRFPVAGTYNIARGAERDGETGEILASPGYVFNGATWDRMRAASGDSLAATGMPAVGQMIVATGGVWNRVNETTALGDGATGTGIPVTQPRLFNGTNYDRERGNIEGTLLASAARTASTFSPTQTNYNHRGVMMWLNVTVAGTGNLYVRLWGQDPITGLNANMTVAPPTNVVTGTGLYAAGFYPGWSTGPSGATAAQTTITASVAVPRKWSASVQHSDGSSWTYSLGYSMIL